MAANEISPLGFLAGGGEMGQLIRQHDWAATALGPPAQWPQSLRTILGVMLHAKVHMLLWWGPEQIQFYNDLCRSSLEPMGKHPAALGQRGADCWPELWPNIWPLIEQVLAGGEATRGENQLIPIERNARLENVYWTFGYSPVWGEASQVAGVLLVGRDTTAEVLALREQQERYRFVLEAAQFSFWEVDVATNIVHWDDRSAELFGHSYRGNTLPQEQAFQAVHPDDLPALGEALARATNPASGGHYDFTCRVLGANDGQLRWGRFIGQAYFNAAGEVTRFQGIAHNVTRDKELQQQLAASLAKLRMIFDKAPVGMCVVRGPELIFEFVNERYQEMTSREGVSLVGQPLGFGVPVPMPQLPAAVTMLREVLSTGQALTFSEFPLTLPRNGRLKLGYYNMVVEPLYDENGRPSRVFVSVAEVTPSVLSRHRVEANEAYLQQVFRHAAVGIVIYRGENNVIELVNPLVSALIGLPEDQLLGRPLFDVLPETARLGGQALAAIRQTGQPFIGTELPYALPQNGEIRTMYVDLVCEPLLDNGQVHRIIQTMTDVTERVLARRHVEEMLERERKLNVLKSNFVTLASHEFRTPLGTILSSAALIGRYNRPDQEDKRKRHVQRIRAAVHGLTSVLEDFISFSRMEQQTLQSPRHTLELTLFCEEILEDLQQVSKPGQRLVYRHLAGSPAIMMHGQVLKHILLNLLSNASKYSAADQEITLTTAVRGDQLVLTVKDEGIGIPEADQDRLFVDFFRARNARHVAGTGLGLYIVKHYVDLLGGRITFTSVLDVGTTFTVQLPLPPLLPAPP